MIVFVLHRYWNTPDNEGADVAGVYRDVEGAIDDMKSAAQKVKSYYPKDYWEPDMTWEDDAEIHLAEIPMLDMNWPQFIVGQSPGWK